MCALRARAAQRSPPASFISFARSTPLHPCSGTFDFVYLPIDFRNRCNLGYCFIK